MRARPLNLFTIPPDIDFLPALARAILAGGFPLPSLKAPGPADLSRWTILVPTRRAARALEETFLDLSNEPAVLLPRIRPIGDIDEDLLAPGDDADETELAPAISGLAREFLLIGLIDEWVRDNPHERLAAELRGAPAQAQSLARSLADLVNAFETEEADLDALPQLFDGELARHREAILGFLAIVRRRLPEELQCRGLLGPMQRRSALLRIEAQRLRDMPAPGPVIAAGSTGSIPATAELLRTIAGLGAGAVILPGLDLVMDDESFAAAGPQHPQYALKRLLEEWQAKRGDVAPLPGIAAAAQNAERRWLASEIMRPSETAGAWMGIARKDAKRVAAGMHNIELVGAKTRREEATAIALILRGVLEEEGKTAALVTPDRELARRVKSEMRRWNVEIDDSAGEPLIRSPQGSFIAVLIDAISAGFGVLALASLLHHPLSRFGLDAADARAAASVFDLAVLRHGMLLDGEQRFTRSLAEARKQIAGDVHAHPLLRRVDDERWRKTEALAAFADKVLVPPAQAASFANHLDHLTASAMAIAPAIEDGEAGEVLAAVLESLRQAVPFLPPGDFFRAALAISSALARTPVRSRRRGNERLSILGLLEARLVSADVTILAGLNEGVWPAQPDAGPWLNRPMRQTLGLDMPERQIGVTAHDFIQSFSARRLVLTWSGRIGDEPAVPSRWVLRLQMLLKAAGVEAKGGDWAAWAGALDPPQGDAPVKMPRPKPPVALRPKQLSITNVEKLIRDPYAIYAQRILRLKPLRDLAQGADYSLRGKLFHDALARFAQEFPAALPDDAETRLSEIAKAVFAEHLINAEVMGFWWPRFQRVIPWWIEQERVLRADARQVHAEIDMKYEFDGFTLIGRADRVELLADGTARIIDFKTGSIPSGPQVEEGFSPQLTLEAALLARGAFTGVPALETADLRYVKLSGGNPPGEMRHILSAKVMSTAQEHLARFKELIADYARDDVGYLPRNAMEREDDVSDYDHLSRWKEWASSGDVE